MVIEDGVRHIEANIDTFTCGHCNAVKHVKPRSDPADLGGLCKQCMGLVCPRCYAKGTCTTWEEQMLRSEAKDRFRRDFEAA